jgi:hypothetical protein
VSPTSHVYHVVQKVQVGHGVGMADGEQHLSVTVFMNVWSDLDQSEPQRFAIHIDDAEKLAVALTIAVEKARKKTRDD